MVLTWLLKHDKRMNMKKWTLDSIRCLSLVSMSDVAETFQRMVGHTPTEQLSGTLFQKTKAR